MYSHSVFQKKLFHRKLNNSHARKQFSTYPICVCVYFGLAFTALPAHTLLLVLVSVLVYITCLDSFPVLLFSRGQSKISFCGFWVGLGFFYILKQPLYNLLNILFSVVFKQNSFWIWEISLGLIVVAMSMSFQTPCDKRLIVSSVLKCCSIYSLSNSFFFYDLIVFLSYGLENVFAAINVLLN